MTMTSWPPPAQTEIAVHVGTDGLPGEYPAVVRLGSAELFDDGWQPMLTSADMATLLTDLAAIGDEDTQLAVLGWTLRTADGGRIELIETNLPAEDLDHVNGRWLLPRECGFSLTDELDPLAQVYRSLTLLEAYAYGPSNQLTEPAALVAEARTAARALGAILGALIGLAVDTDADTARAALTDLQVTVAAPDSGMAGDAADVGERDEDAVTIRVLHHELAAAAAHVVALYRPTAPTAGSSWAGRNTSTDVR